MILDVFRGDGNFLGHLKKIMVIAALWTYNPLSGPGQFSGKRNQDFAPFFSAFFAFLIHGEEIFWLIFEFDIIFTLFYGFLAIPNFLNT